MALFGNSGTFYFSPCPKQTTNQQYTIFCIHPVCPLVCCQSWRCSVGLYFRYEIFRSKAAGIETDQPWRAAWRRWSSWSDLKRLLSMLDSYLWSLVRTPRLFNSSCMARPGVNFIRMSSMALLNWLRFSLGKESIKKSRLDRS